MRAILMLILCISLLMGCSADRSNDFSAWSEESVYRFLNEINRYISEIPIETDNKEDIVKLYEKYFSPELSVKIVDSLYVKTESGWKIPDGDAGYLFVVPNNEQNEVSIKINNDSIIVQEYYESWMYSKIQYTLSYAQRPIITEWMMENSPSPLMLNETVLYPENEPPSIKIKISSGEWKEISTVDDYPSKPEISSDQMKLAFIAPFEFEMAGEAWLYDAKTGESTKIFTQDQAGKEKSVKQILWADSNHLLILTGHTYGTVSSNRSLYLLNTNDNDLRLIVQAQENQDIRDLALISGTTISFSMITYNEDFTNHVSESKTVDITNLFN